MIAVIVLTCWAIHCFLGSQWLSLRRIDDLCALNPLLRVVILTAAPGEQRDFTRGASCLGTSAKTNIRLSALPYVVKFRSITSVIFGRRMDFVVLAVIQAMRTLQCHSLKPSVDLAAVSLCDASPRPLSPASLTAGRFMLVMKRFD